MTPHTFGQDEFTYSFMHGELNILGKMSVNIITKNR